MSGGEGVNNVLDPTEILADIADVQSDVTDILADLVIIEQEIYEVEHHLHNHEKWFGVAAVPAGETHIADRLGPGIVPFALLSGNDAYGNWLQVVGSSDTPVQADRTRFDLHRYLVTTTNDTDPFVIQFIEGEAADIAAKVALEDMTEAPYISATNNADSGISDVIGERIAVRVKCWARAICIGKDAKTINIYIGIHEYVR